MDLPGPVPGFVDEIHRTVGALLSGSIDSLGSAVNDLTSSGKDPGARAPEDAGA